MPLSHSFAFGFGEDVENALAYASQIAKLLPPGVLWNFEEDSTLRGALLGIADEFTRVRIRGTHLIDETDPRTASETLEDWERVLGLPDELITTIPAGMPERRVAITQKVVSRGGQNYDFFDVLCAAAGYPLVSIELFAESVLRAGFRVSDRVYGDVYAYTMHVTVDPPTGAYLTNAELERVIRAATHSHIEVMFTFN